MKKFWKISVLLLMVTLLSTCFFACDKNDKPTKATTFVTMDINPSIEFVLDAKGKVLSYRATNDDAAILLYGESGIVGKDIKTASGKILDLSFELGFLTEDNKGINITVISSNGVDTENKVFDDINVSIKGKQSKFDLKINAKRTANFSLERETKKLKEENKGKPGYDTLTASKLSIIKTAMMQNPDLTMDIAVTYDVERLLTMAVGGSAQDYDKYKELETQAFREAKKLAQKTYENTLETLKATIWFEKYMGFKPLDIISASNYMILNSVENGLEISSMMIKSGINFANGMIENKDAQEIATLLGMTVDELKDSDGNLTIESINNAIDKKIKNMTAEELNAIKGKLDILDTKLDEMSKNLEEKGLPEKYSKMIKAYTALLKTYVGDISEIVVGDTITFEDIDAWTKVCKDKANVLMTEMKAKLTAEQITEIEKAVNEKVDLIEAQKAEFEKQIEDAKKQAQEFLKDKKEELRKNHGKK